MRIGLLAWARGGCVAGEHVSRAVEDEVRAGVEGVALLAVCDARRTAAAADAVSGAPRGLIAVLLAACRLPILPGMSVVSLVVVVVVRASSRSRRLDVEVLLQEANELVLGLLLRVLVPGTRAAILVDCGEMVGTG
jgi:hypothetical protein